MNKVHKDLLLELLRQPNLDEIIPPEMTPPSPLIYTNPHKLELMYLAPLVDGIKTAFKKYAVTSDFKSFITKQEDLSPLRFSVAGEPYCSPYLITVLGQLRFHTPPQLDENHWSLRSPFMMVSDPLLYENVYALHTGFFYVTDRVIEVIPPAQHVIIELVPVPRRFTSSSGVI